MFIEWLKRLPKEEIYALTNQMRRSAISIPSNIAERQARNSTKEFIQFLSIANGFKAELETQLLICVDIGYLSLIDIESIMNELNEIGKIITSLKQTLLSTKH